jgi:hypothetical protein
MKNIVLAKCFAGATVSLLLGFMLVDCGNTPDSIGGGGQSGGGSTGTSTGFNLPDANPNGNGGGGSTGATPTGDANCGSATSNTSKAPVDVLLVLDRSGSMTESITTDCCCADACTTITRLKMCPDTTTCTERWPALTSAVNTTISSTTEISWGLKFFSTPPAPGKQQSDGCNVSSPGVEATIGSSAATIQAQIAAVSPSSNTPTAKAITAATAYLKTVKDQNNKVILLATDGEPNCASSGSSTASDVAGTVAAIQAAMTAGFKVYVIGIGPSVGNLDNFAQAGGTNKSYPATSAADLGAALASISAAVSSCSFTFTAPAGSDVSNIAVYVDGKLVAKDAANGWSVGATAQTVQLNGSTCELVKSSAAQVQVYFGCAGSPPPPLL